MINSIAIEKPYSRTSIFVEGGQAMYSPGQDQWRFYGDAREITGNWVNLHDRIGWITKRLGMTAAPSIRLPDPGKRGRLSFVSRPTAVDNHALFVFAFPDQTHADTQAAAKAARCTWGKSGHPFDCSTPAFSLIINVQDREFTFVSDKDHPSEDGKMSVPPQSVLCWRRGGPRLF